METLTIKVDGLRKKMKEDVQLPELIRAFYNHGAEQPFAHMKRKGKGA